MTSPFASGPGPAAVYFGFRAGAWLAEHTPRPVAYWFAHMGGRLAYRKAHGKRGVVEKNLARVVGTGDHLDEVVKAAFLSYAEYWLETFRLGRYKPEDLMKMVEPVGNSLEVIEDALSEGKGILVITPHLGFYDLGVAWVGAKGWPFTSVAEVLRPKALFEWFARIRERHGLKVLPARNGKWVREKLSDVLDAGECVALVSDRDLGRRGIWVEFFGERTTFPVSPAMLLVQKKVPLIAGAITKNGRTFDIYFERVPYELSGEAEADVRSMAQVTAGVLEKMVRRAPEQWHLFMTNWPADEAHLPPRGRKSDSSPQPAPPGLESPVEPAPLGQAGEADVDREQPAETAVDQERPVGAAVDQRQPAQEPAGRESSTE
ncbi:MAG: phosphatidylinositol mannoside acyltransferase [Actinomycetota bacterium]